MGEKHPKGRSQKRDRAAGRSPANINQERKNGMPKIILASSSPRRRELLAQIGLAFEVWTSDVEERASAVWPGDLVEKLSCLKAEAVLEMLTDIRGKALVIGADTVVAQEGQMLGKPSNRTEAAEMLRRLSGRIHEVYTGVTLLYKGTSDTGTAVIGGGDAEAADARGAGGRICRKVFHEVTRVSLYPLTEEEIRRYVSTGDCMDKAGAYGIQGYFARFVKQIEGDYNNVVGLPVGRLYQEAKEWMEE